MSRKRMKVAWEMSGRMAVNDPISDQNIGRKLLEKMGWESGDGLGKEKQGMVENPLWKYRRDDSLKIGLASKEERCGQAFCKVNGNDHQNAFDNLLNELNAETNQESSANTFERVTKTVAEITSKRPVRYLKIARAKDIRNYSLKDLEGIIGKEVVEKNFKRGNVTKDDINKGVYRETSRVSSSRSINHSPSNSTKSSKALKDNRKKHMNRNASPDVLYSRNFDGSNDMKASKQGKNERNCKDQVNSNTSNSDLLKCEELHTLSNSAECEGHDSSYNGIKSGLKLDLQASMTKKNKKRKRLKECNESKSGSNSKASANSKSIEEVRTEKGMEKANSENILNETLKNSDKKSANGTILSFEEINMPKRLANDPKVIEEVCDGFPGADLMSIKGYGNW